MYNTPYFNIERLNRQKEEIDNLIKTYQSQPVQPINNIINTSNPLQDYYEIKKLNDGDEVENIFASNNTIFIGSNRMQIKKLDGTIEKYTIERYYPIDEKDEQIKELNKKVQELERKLNNEHTKSSEPIKEFDKSISNDVGNVEPKSKTNSKSNAKQN